MPSIPSGIMKRKTIALSEDKKEPKCCDATAVSAQRSIGLEINGMAAVSTAEPVTSQYIPWGWGCLSPSRPPSQYPRESAIMIVPITLVIISCVVPKLGARSRNALISMAMILKPATNTLTKINPKGIKRASVSIGFFISK